MDFLVLGNPRSGTSLLRIILNSHTDIVVPPESGFLHWWYPKYKNWSIVNSKNVVNVNEFLDDLFVSKKIEGWGLDRQKLFAKIREKEPQNYLGLISTIYRFYSSKRIVGDKNNYFIDHLEELDIICENPKYIHIVRDGRDVACSYANVLKLSNISYEYLPKFNSSIESIAQEWNSNIEKVDNFLINKTFITIKYEELITNTELVMSSICSFLGVRFDPNMLKYYLYNDEPEITRAWKHKTFESIDPKNQKKYLNILTPENIQRFNKIAAKSLLKYNYEI